MKVWNFDADQIHFKDNLTVEDIVVNDEISDFLKIREDALKLFLIAPKGLGKTLILKVKSLNFRDNHSSGYKFIPATEPCEKVSIYQFSIRQENISSFEQVDVWRQIWRMCLTLTILKRFDITLPESFSEKLKNAKEISDILNVILQDWKFFLYKVSAQFASEIMPLLRDINSQVAVFIDSLDQTIGQLVSSQGINYDDNKQIQSAINLWSNAQVGLLYAIHEICVQKRHIKIFATIREEAFELDTSDLHQQIKDYSSFIRYDENQLREIFISNIKMTDTASLVLPKANDPLERFFGLRHIPHSFIQNTGEDVFSFIHRHTFGRPRELVLIGSRINQMDPKQRTIENLRNKVNKISHEEIFDQFKKEIIPFFDERMLKKFCNKLQYNIFTREEMKSLSKKQLQYYYKLGLIGALRREFKNNHYVQVFREAYKFNYNETIDLPESNYYFTHPAMDGLLIDELKKEYNKLEIIIGYNYPFKLPSPKINIQTPSKAVHFGVGNLGCGLVLPLLQQTHSGIAFINRRSDKWNDAILKAQKRLSIKDSLDNETSFHLLYDELDSSEKQRLIDKWSVDQDINLLVISEDKELLESIIEKGTVITTALKKRDALLWCADLLREIKFVKDVVVYPFENEKSLVQTFRNALKSNKSIKVANVIADRMCSRIDFNPTSIGLTLFSKREEFGEVVIQDLDPNSVFAVSKFMEPERVIITKSELEQNFYYQKKFWIFNCVHAVLSCYCYNSLKEHNIPEKEWESVGYINLLQDLDSIREKTKLISKAQILRLMHETEKSVLNTIYPGKTNNEIFIDLFDYSEKILKRISSIPDKLLRVLPLNDFDMKFHTRIQELIEFYNDQKKYDSIKELGALANEDDYRQIRKTINSLLIEISKLAMAIIGMQKKGQNSKPD